MKKCLYLVSSSASREYVVDCVEALALPRGSILHFRYLHAYIDQHLSKLLDRKRAVLPRSLRDLPVVVVYLFQVQKSGVWKPEGAYLPLRYGRLIHAFSEGQVAHFYFELGDYVRPKYKGVSIREALKKERIGFKVSPAKNAKPSFAHVAQSLRLAAPRTRDSLAFQSFVQEVYRPGEWRTRSVGSVPLDVTYDIVFFRIVGIFRERGDRMTQLTPVQRRIGDNVVAEYVLSSGETYHIKVMTQLSPRMAAELPGEGRAWLRLNFDRELIRPVGPVSFRISSLYDLQYWSFVAECRRNEHGVLTIGCEYDVSRDRQEFLRRELLCPEINLPISIVSERPPAGQNPA